VDEHDTVHDGPYPGALRDVLGLSIEEFHPLRENETVRLSDSRTGRIWSERVRLAGAQPVCDFTDGFDAGHPAVTRHEFGRGIAWYVATALDDLRALVARALDEAGVARPNGLPETLEVVRRGEFLFLINHGPDEARVDGVHGLSLLDGEECAGTAAVPAGDVRVVRVTGG
jgi:beta-galactosidase